MPPLSFNKLFFKNPTYNFNIDFPKGLIHFLEIVQQDFSAEQIVKNHSLIPFYEKFISKEKKKGILEYSMDDKNRIKIGVYGAISTWSGRAPKICQYCAQDDIKTFNEIYYHRIHQLPDILVCTKHNVFLEIVDRVKPGKMLDPFVYPSAVYQYGEAKTNTNKIIHDIAILAAQMLESKNIDFYAYDFVELARNKGYSNENRQAGLNLLRLTTDANKYFYSVKKSFYPEHYFNFRHLLHNGNRRISLPLRYLSLYYFLVNCKDSIPPKFNDPVKLFESGPWTCINFACKNYEKPTLNKIKIHKTDKDKFKGTLICEDCGMIYSIHRSHSYSNIRIEECGEKWAKFVQKKINQGVTRNALCNLMKISLKNLTYWISWYKLKVPWKNKRKIKRRNLLASRSKRRKEWLKLIKNSKSTTLKVFGWKYQWFLKYDRDWLFKTNKKYWRTGSTKHSI